MAEEGDSLCFEVLALDSKRLSVIRSEVNLLHSLLSNAHLWRSPHLDETGKKISDGAFELIVTTVSQDGTCSLPFERAFLINAKGPFDNLEPMRHPLVEHLDHQHLGPLYVLCDTVSEHIACRLYPCLYRVENALRGYLVKFMTTRLGPQWWEAGRVGFAPPPVY